MLLHHYTAASSTPSGAPNFRNNWQTELDNLGYPQNLRKIALINGAINGTTQGTACENILKLKVKLAHINIFLLFAGFINIAEGNIWFTGSHGSSCNVFKGWAVAPFISDAKTAAAPSSSKSYDIVPGGYYNAQSSLAGAPVSVDFYPLIGAIIPTLFLGSVTSTQTQVLNPNHSFIPTFSALGMNTANKDLSENLYNRDLTCTGETPFEAYYAPLVNQEHITLTAENVAWIKAEIAGNKQMSSVNYTALYPMVKTSGGDPVCTNATYQVNNLPAGSTIAWQSSNPTIATVTATGNPATITRQGTQNGTVTITATITRSCGSPVIISKVVTVGSGTTGSITATYNSPSNPAQPLYPLAKFDLTTYYDACLSLRIIPTNVPAGATVTWSATAPGAVWQQSGNYFVCFFTALNQTADVNLSISNACGSSSAHYRFRCINTGLCGGPTPSRAIVSPNPAQTTVTVTLNEEDNMAAKAGIPAQSGSNITQVKIYNTYGATVKSVRYAATAKQVQVDVSGLAAGLYFIEVSNGAVKQTKRLVIAR